MLEYTWTPTIPTETYLPSWGEVVEANTPPVVETIPDLLAWGRKYLPAHIAKGGADFHEELARALRTETRIAVAAPRQHAKSTLICVVYCLYAAAVLKEPYIVIVSDTLDQAKEHLDTLREELTNNEQLLEDYPHLRLPQGGDYKKGAVARRRGDLTTLGGIKIVAKGARGSLRGMKKGHQRPTLILVDDLENDTAVLSETMRNKLEEWFFKALTNLLSVDSGRIVVAGTILHGHSLLSKLTDERRGPSTYWRRVYSAYIETPDPLNEGQTITSPLWPQQWSMEKLEAKRIEIGPRAFSTEFLNLPVSDELVLWLESWLSSNRVTAGKVPDLQKVVIAVDPNAVGGKGLDVCGIIAAGADVAASKDREGYMLEDHSTKGGPAVWGRVVLDAYAKHNADAIIAEGNQGGEMVRQTIRAALHDNEAMPLVLIVNATRGKYTRAEPVSVLDQQGRIHMVGNHAPLETELTTWMPLPNVPSPGRLDAYVWAFTYLLLGTITRKGAVKSRGRRTVR